MNLSPNYTDTITYYHKGPNGWTRDVYDGCFFRSAITVVQSDTSERVVNTYTVRIPYDVAGPAFAASPGDIIIKGMCTDTIDDSFKGSRAAEVLNAHKPDAFRVSAVSDNTGRPIDKHWRMGG